MSHTYFSKEEYCKKDAKMCVKKCAEEVYLSIYIDQSSEQSDSNTSENGCVLEKCVICVLVKRCECGKQRWAYALTTRDETKWA